MSANGHNSINFSLSDEHREIQRLARDFARKEIAPKAEHYDKTHEYPWPIIREAQKLGLTTMAVPEQYGGLGLLRHQHGHRRQRAGRAAGHHRRHGGAEGGVW